MSREEEATRCKSGLNESLREVDEFTAGSAAPAWRLLHRMNGVLRAAVDTDFGAACQEPLGDLCAAIGATQPGMVADCENLPLLYFARSFAVVLDEAVRQLHEDATATEPPPSNTVAKETDEETPNEDQLDEMKEEEKRYPAADESQLVGSERWRRSIAKQNPGKHLDFSQEAVKGRLLVSYEPTGSVQRHDLWQLLLQFGSVIELRVPDAARFAFVKLESDAAADAAVAALHGSRFGCATLSAKRLDFLNISAGAARWQRSSQPLQKRVLRYVPSEEVKDQATASAAPEV